MVLCVEFEGTPCYWHQPSESIIDAVLKDMEKEVNGVIGENGIELAEHSTLHKVIAAIRKVAYRT